DMIRNALTVEESNNLILASDIMEPTIATIYAESFLSVAKEYFKRDDLEYLPVVDKEGRLTGFLERKMLNKLISTRISELYKQADSLDRNLQ
ncbi:MAG: CBS domain-containing protein, partial [Candidatus Omnitrophica bacterium]|nr:CBS domain-containing protein [Candidatus Omnitrophota bacterium]